MSIKSRNTLKSAIGLAVISGTLSAPMAAVADGNPFLVTELSGGYQLADKHSEGKCGEGKCGEDKAAKDGEGKCGEGKCGEDKAAKDAEGKCGEGKCGESKDGEG